jgi:hypothetical protein
MRMGNVRGKFDVWFYTVILIAVALAAFVIGILVMHG